MDDPGDKEKIQKLEQLSAEVASELCELLRSKSEQKGLDYADSLVTAGMCVTRFTGAIYQMLEKQNGEKSAYQWLVTIFGSTIRHVNKTTGKEYSVQLLRKSED